MEINQYNFIRGSRNSGKTLFARKVITCLSNPIIYYTLDFASTGIVDKVVRNQSSRTSIHNPTFGKILGNIKNILNDDNMWNVVFDPITSLQTAGNYSNNINLSIFINSLPKNHRYFFITDNRDPLDYKICMERRSETFESYSKHISVPESSISIFNTYRELSEISIYNYNSNEYIMLGDVSQTIRDIKINEILR